MKSKYRDGGLIGRKQPSEKQKAYGNYSKGHAVLHGMRVSIENEAGTDRHGTSEEGKKWKQRLAHDYGYIRGTTGKDKDHIDVFLGPEADKPDHKVHVIDQYKKDGTFDEHKAMLGFPDRDSAIMGYHRNYEPGWDGFGAATEMDIKQFKDWAYAGRSGKRKPASELVGFKKMETTQPEAQDLAKGGTVEGGTFGDDLRALGWGRPMADGGSVEPTAEELELASKPYIGARGRRAERNNDRAGATSMPASLLRGVAAGTAGLPGDLEGLARMASKLPSATPVQAILSKLVGGDDTPALPTSEFYNEWLPGRVEGPQQRAAEGLGNLFGLDPMGATRAAKAVGRGAAAAGQRALPAVKDVLESMGPQIEGALSKLAPAAQPMYAVKPKGGNWIGNGPEEAAKMLHANSFDKASPAAQWLEKRLPKWIRNEMGTIQDPLLALEKEGISHMQDLPGQAATRGFYSRKSRRPGTENQYDVHDEDFHKQATGRDYATPWENLTDGALERESIKDILQPEHPDWMWKADPSEKVHQLGYSDVRHVANNLGFDHMRDYIEQAMEAGKWAKNNTPDQRMATLAEGAENPYHGTLERHSRLIDRGLAIDPDDLGKMSLPDMVRKTDEWNKMLAETKKLKDVNKGIKQVMKQYPDSGMQWAELDETGLADEGNAMGHCVGGYCSQVKGGNTRIVSLRDKKGQPHVTVELGREAPPSGFSYSKFKDVMTPEEIARFEAYESPMKHQYPLEAKLLDEKRYEELLKAKADQTPWNIRQIKGKGNAAPIEEYQSAVQDFVKNMGPWGEIDDLHNTGLRRSTDIFNSAEIETLKKQGKTVPEGYMTHEEIMQLQGLFPGKGYAQGGTIPNQETVGTGTFGQGPAGQAPQQQLAQGTPMNMGMSAPQGNGFTPGGGLNLNPVTVAGAPTYDLNTAGGLAALQAGGAMGGGMKRFGLNAFLPGNVNELDFEQSWNNKYNESGANDGENNPNVQDSAAGLRQLGDATKNVASQLGYDTSKYDMGNFGAEGAYRGASGTPADRMEDQALRAAGLPGRMDTKPGDQKNFMDFWGDANKDLKDVGRFTTASAGWDGRNDPRSTATTMYYQRAPNVWEPISKPQFGRQREHGGWAKEEGAETLTALSIMMPMFTGGFGAAGAFGNLGTYGTMAANAGMGAVRGGTAGALSSLGGALGGQAGTALGGSLGNVGSTIGGQVGSQVGQYAGRALAGQNKAKGGPVQGALCSCHKHLA